MTKLTDPHRKRGRRSSNINAGRRTRATTRLQPRGLAGPAGHQDAIAEAGRIARRGQVRDLFINHHLTYAQIAARLGVSNKTVASDLARSLDELQAETLADTAKWRAVENRRLDREARVLVPILYGQVGAKAVLQPGRGKKGRAVVVEVPQDPLEVKKLQMWAADRLLRIEESRRRLWGVDRPTKIALTDPEGHRPYEALTLAELEAAIAAKEVALGLAPTRALTIDVTAVSGNGGGPDDEEGDDEPGENEDDEADR